MMQLLVATSIVLLQGAGRGAVPAHHGVDGLHPGLQLFLVWGLEKVVSPVTNINLQITEYQNENYKA